MSDLTLEQIKDAKRTAESEIAGYVIARLGHLAKESGVRPVGLSISVLRHWSDGNGDGLLVTDVTIDMGSI